MNTNQENDLSLLRPFDLEAAKAGAIVQWHEDTDTLVYVGPTTYEEEHCFKWLDGEYADTYATYHNDVLRMAPLFWCEGKPVYKGDVLYYKLTGQHFVIDTYSKLYKTFTAEGDSTPRTVNTLTWTKPVKKIKKEGWINIYKTLNTNINAVTSNSYASEEIAKGNLDNRLTYIKTIHAEWEVEE